MLYIVSIILWDLVTVLYIVSIILWYISYLACYVIYHTTYYRIYRSISYHRAPSEVILPGRAGACGAELASHDWVWPTQAAHRVGRQRRRFSPLLMVRRSGWRSSTPSLSLLSSLQLYDYHYHHCYQYCCLCVSWSLLQLSSLALLLCKYCYRYHYIMACEYSSKRIPMVRGTDFVDRELALHDYHCCMCYHNHYSSIHTLCSLSLLSLFLLVALSSLVYMRYYHYYCYHYCY